MRFVPAHLLDGRPHVIVDGAPRPGTVYTLSHWPGTPTPIGLDGDLSAEIVAHALARPDLLPEPVPVVSLDHYDVDGVVSLALAVLDGLAATHGPLLTEVARVGDFDVVTRRDAALIAFSLAALADGGSGGGAPPGADGADGLALCAMLSATALGLVGDLVADAERFEDLWHGQYAAYEASVGALAAGWATVEEVPSLDLAVVRVDSAHERAAAAAWKAAPLHPAAVHGVSDALRVASFSEGRMEMRYRYESWVRLASRRPRPRVDLERLARRLTAGEEWGSRWVFDGAGALRGALHLAGVEATTSIEPARLLGLLSEELALLDQGPAAWDPYRAPRG
ncbi:MAG: DUF6687 family protein [Acidimicrobiales bacterium]